MSVFVTVLAAVLIVLPVVLGLAVRIVKQ